MLDVINRYLHGFVAVPVILACRKKGLFELLQHQGSPLTRQQIVESLGANGGHLQVALRMIRSLNWLERNEVGQYSLTDEAQLHKKIPEEILDLYHLPFESYLMGEQPSGLLKNWISRSIQRWNVDDPIWADFLDGILVIPILLALHKHNTLVEDKHKPLFSQLSAPVREELYELFTSKGWALRQEDRFCLTDVGRFIVGRALITGTTASYTPMLSRMTDVLFGDCQAVFNRNTSGQESHVDRTLNVVASGFQHEKYFADVEDIILSIFNQLPIEEQPKYVVDMGCGDGTLLKRVYETIQSKSARGKELHQYPLCAIGVDYNEASITATARTLADIPHLVLKGDIGDPEQMITSLKSHGIHDPENILHIRSFLDHDRPFIPPQNLDQVQVRSLLPYQGVYVAPSGEPIPPHVMVQSLVEHLERWSKVVTKQGLIILEVHCLEPEVVNRFLDKSENLHFDAYQAFSMQHLVEADVFLMAAAEVGLFPKCEFSKRYPKTFPFTRITLNCFEKRPYRIRHPHLSDLPALVNLEAKCWPKHLRASSDEIQQRLECFPNGHCVLEMDSQIVGVVYSQRIFSADVLKNTTYAEVQSLHTKQGAVIQLLGINILPELQDKGLGDQIREFMLQLCALKGGIERVVGVTRCKNYVSHAHISIEEYIYQRNERGQRLDPIVRFHEEGGATIEAIIPNYRPEDADNWGTGVLIAYDIRDRQPRNSLPTVKKKALPDSKQVELREKETLDEIIEEGIRFVIGDRRMEAFAPKRPLMEMGLDSLELLELRAILSQRIGVELESTFFFNYGTPEAIARYFEGKETAKNSTAPASPPTITRDWQKEAGAESDLSDEMKQALRQLKEMQFKLSALADAKTEPIAIIGMGCRFPGAKDPQAFWQLLRDGKVAISEVPADRWDVDAFYDPNMDSHDKMNTRWGGFLEDTDQFDPSFFGVSAGEAAAMDPQQRLLLEVSWEALENAGVAPDKLAGSQTGVFVGIITCDYYKLLLNPPLRAGTGIFNSIVANRLSYLLDLRGPSMAVDTACSSSLVAVHLACQSLRTRESNLAIAGGVNLILSPEWTIAFSQAGMMAKDGRCKTFDAAADGYVRGEGCGAVILKRLSDALKDGDRILAVLRGSAVNQDGRSVGLTAPNGLAQQALIRQALENAGVSPQQIDYIEAHGTGTPLGDATEVQSLGAVLGQGRSTEQQCALGAVKTNIGHLEGAAGIAGLIKAILSLQHGEIPPHPHLKEINPNIGLEKTPFVIPTKQNLWKSAVKPSFAGVSSFGIGGTNAHVVLEAAPDLNLSVLMRGDSGAGELKAGDRPLHVLTLSAKSEKALKELASSYENHLENQPADALADVCFTANTGRSHFDCRLAIVADSADTLRLQLAAFSTRTETTGVFSGKVTSQKRPKIAFLFTGQGSQYAGMGRQLYDTQPIFREALNQCDELLRPHLHQSLLSLIYPASGDSSTLNETRFAQPALFALEYALAKLWQSWGIEPDAVMGHSVGEYVAACLAGVFSLEDGLLLISERGRLMGSPLPREGAMAAVFAEESLVANAIAPYRDSISIAAVNGPKQTVISGTKAAVEAVLESLESDFVMTRPLNVSHAFHSHLMEPILDQFEQIASTVQFVAPQGSLISNVTGETVQSGKVLDANYWRNHIRQPVRFCESMQTLAANGCELFLEIGSMDTLIGMGKRCLPKGTWLASLKQGEDNWRSLLDSLATLYVGGADINWTGFDQHYPRRPVALPVYPFQRKRCWLDASELKSYQKKMS
jgi:malonyl CoA-acyl carrier protein transacylase